MTDVVAVWFASSATVLNLVVNLAGRPSSNESLSVKPVCTSRRDLQTGL